MAIRPHSDFSALIALALSMTSISLVHVLTEGWFNAPPPPQASSSPDVWQEYISTLEPIHMIAPLMAHWSGAFIGGLIMALLSMEAKMKHALIISGIVMVAGIMNAIQIPGQPLWFIALDLAGYLPMGWLGWKLALKIKPIR